MFVPDTGGTNTCLVLCCDHINTQFTAQGLVRAVLWRSSKKPVQEDSEDLIVEDFDVGSS